MQEVRNIERYDDATLELIGSWPSVKCAAEELGISESAIVQCCKRKYKTAGGYIWRYTGEDILPLYDKK